MIKRYEKSKLFDKHQTKLNEDTMAKKQKSPERRTYTKVRLSCCAAG